MYFVGVLVALVTIVNPFSTISLFLTITKGDSIEKKRAMARRASIVSACVLIVFALAGTYVLTLFSITLDAFRIAGGILIAGIGYRMVKATRECLSTDLEKEEAAKKQDVSIIPLAIPMTAGPGAMTTSLVLMGDAVGAGEIAALIIAIIAACVLTYFVLSRSEIIGNYLGETGQKVTDKIMGLIVMVVGVQFIINGVSGLLTTWGI